jgi:hypothetical protein
MTNVSESILQLINLESQNPQFAGRLRFLQIVQSNNLTDISLLINQTGFPKFEIEYWIELYRLGGIELLLYPQTILNPYNAQTKTLSQYAEEELLRLYNHHPRQVGSAVIRDFRSCQKIGKPIGSAVESCDVFKPYNDFQAIIKDWDITDCFTYIKNVLRYTYEKLGQPGQFTNLNKADRGTYLADKLNALGWKSYLCLRDTENPYDGEEKHVKKFKESNQTKKWWTVGLSGFIVNYKPNPNPILTGKVVPLDPEGKRKYDALTQVGFAVAVFTEGRHTGLFSRGEIYEVHWASMSEQSKVGNTNYDPLYNEALYEKTTMQDFGWEEILLVIPPDSKVSLV